MPCDKKRWGWLLQTYRDLSEDQHNKIIMIFTKDHGGRNDDVVLHEALMAMGITIIGEDPNPSRAVPITDAGAEEYEEIMEIMQCTSLEKP